MIQKSASDNGIKPRAPRQKTLKTGRIAINEMTSTFEVLIRDMSETGARLVMSDIYPLPLHFDLIVLNPNTGRPSRTPCQVAWQKGLTVGVMFRTDDVPVPSSPDHLG
ncbi:MAG: PilZ domain-containing protein [Alphaproteobacteria bacterium]|nr:PilZ domain-containing protein [Alphaproteobacteria bacterium]MBU2084579.1 PilZ domain-containing protein [Alphaproteobacteria bacterium]MBU2143423.1 PilZ domain-containing protein [Alphaproteobacteria bacterium]MBU2197807.1 PilZ domain-containing protein [Alphaproteobacteria bacterium]